MRVEIDSNIKISAKTVGELSQSERLAGKFGDHDAAGALFRECRKGEQSQHRDTHLAEIVALPPMRWTLQVGIIGADITELTISLTVLVA